MAERWFFPLAAVACLIFTLWGFKDFFFHGKAFPNRPLTPPIRTLLIVHGIAQLAWILLLIVQPTLIAFRKHRWHMALGRFGAALAVALVVLGYMTAIQAARVNPPDSLTIGMHPPQFLYVPLTTIALFAVLVAVGVWQRKKPAIHRVMMLMATVTAVSAALARIIPLNAPFSGTLWEHVFGPVHVTVTLALVLLAICCAVIRRFDQWMAAAIGLIAIAFAVMLPLSATQAWLRFAQLLMG